jgi:hypothetical protein
MPQHPSSARAHRFNNITSASKLPDKADVYIFADGIKPKYEDPVRGVASRFMCWRVANVARESHFFFFL